MPVIPARGRLKQADLEFKESLSYQVEPSLNEGLGYACLSEWGEKNKSSGGAGQG